MAQYGTGSPLQRGIQAATAALQGLAGGNIAGALARASAPELAYFIGHKAGINDNDTAKAIAHAILGGVTASLQGNSAAAGAVGAASGELAAKAIAGLLYPGVSDLSKLTENRNRPSVHWQASPRVWRVAIPPGLLPELLLGRIQLRTIRLRFLHRSLFLAFQ